MIPFLKLPPQQVEPPPLDMASGFEMASYVIFYVFAGIFVLMVGMLTFGSI